MKLLIKNGRVVDPVSKTDDTLDILIDKGKIVELKAKIDITEAEILDASRLVVAPGFIDMHAHLREPGQEHKEDIRTASLAAAKGGFTSICGMPNTRPVNDNRNVTEYILSEARKRAAVNVYAIAAVTRGLEGAELSDLADLAAAGAVAFSDDGRPVQSSLIMRRALEYATSLNVLVIDHCEDKTLTEDGQMNEGAFSTLYGLRGMPAAAEEIMVIRDIILAEKAKARVHIAHLSVKGAVPFVRDAKKRGVRVTAEVTPHHLTLTDESIKSYDTNLKVNPPLRSSEDIQVLMEAVRDGTVDCFATDHAPHSPEEKNTEFDRAPFGINGLETAVSLLIDRLVNKNVITISRFVQMISSNPAEILGLKNKGQIAVGADADLTILNLNKEVVVDVGNFASKSRNCPYHNWKLKGAPVKTIVAGKVVYRF